MRDSINLRASRMELDAEDAHEAHSQILEFIRVAEWTFLALGEALHWFKEHRHYETLGYQTFEAYIGTPEITISRRTAYRCMGIYQTYILELECARMALLEAGVTKLDELRPHVTENNVEEWINKAAALSRSDLRKELEEHGMENAGAEPDSWRFILRGEFTTLNEYIRQERANKYAGNELKQTNTEQAAWQIRWNQEPLDYPVHIHCEWHREDRRTDPDNVAFARKFILDALVEKGVLENDGWKQIRSFHDTFVVDEEPQVVVELREAT